MARHPRAVRLGRWQRTLRLHHVRRSGRRVLGYDPAAAAGRALNDATAPAAASRAKNANAHRAGAASPLSVMLTTTPASPAPKAPPISRTVLIEPVFAVPPAGAAAQ